MWVLSWKKYSLSKFATFVSIIGALTRYGGVMCLVSSLILPGVICIAIGIGIHFLAELIAKSKAKKVSGKVGAQKAQPAPAQPQKAATQAEPKPAQPVQKPPVQQPVTPPVTAQPAATDSATVKCPNCGNAVPQNNKFCNECGTKIIKEKKCLRCGNVLSENDKFCGQCGYQPK
jgi:predicted nucleic acid-binding Zn ribbon protein